MSNEHLHLLAKLVNTDFSSSDISYGTYTKLASIKVRLKHLLSDVRNERWRRDDPLWSKETWGQTLVRYHGLGFITDEQLMPIYCESILLGLHNYLEQDDAGG